jgi:dTDP-4-dehydrorhamnose reductase
MYPSFCRLIFIRAINARDRYTSPSQAALLAEAMMELLERRMVGIFHVVGEMMSRYEFALKVAEALGFDKSLISPARMVEFK